VKKIGLRNERALNYLSQLSEEGKQVLRYFLDAG
jgi:hypothetical protein